VWFRLLVEPFVGAVERWWCTLAVLCSSSVSCAGCRQCGLFAGRVRDRSLNQPDLVVGGRVSCSIRRRKGAAETTCACLWNCARTGASTWRLVVLLFRDGGWTHRSNGLGYLQPRVLNELLVFLWSMGCVLSLVAWVVLRKDEIFQWPSRLLSGVAQRVVGLAWSKG